MGSMLTGSLFHTIKQSNEKNMNLQAKFTWQFSFLSWELYFIGCDLVSISSAVKGNLRFGTILSEAKQQSKAIFQKSFEIYCHGIFSEHSWSCCSWNFTGPSALRGPKRNCHNPKSKSPRMKCLIKQLYCSYQVQFHHSGSFHGGKTYPPLHPC